MQSTPLPAGATLMRPNMTSMPSSQQIPTAPPVNSIPAGAPAQPGPHPYLQMRFPSGAGVLRLLQYSEALGHGPDRNEIGYWRSFVDEFFVPTGVFRLVLWNPSSREQKAFEVPTCVLPRYLHTSYVSGLRSSQLTLDNPREYNTGWPPVNPLPPPPTSHKFLNSFPTPNVTHQIDASKAMFVSSFDNGWQVQMVGLMRAAFVPYARPITTPAPDGSSSPTTRLDLQLRLESLDFTVHAHTGYIPRVAIQKTKVEHPIPSSLVSSIQGDGSGKKNGRKGSNNGEGDSTHATEDETHENGDPAVKTEDGAAGDDKSGFTVAVEKTFLPDYPVNEYGISLRAMRCLEITESVCQLRDLIDVSARDKLGPIDSLRKFATQYREAQANRQMPNGQQQPSHVENGQPGRPPSAQGEGGAASSPSVMANGSAPATKRKSKIAPSPSPKLGATSSPAKRQR